MNIFRYGSTFLNCDLILMVNVDHEKGVVEVFYGTDGSKITINVEDMFNFERMFGEFCAREGV